jgi:squalene-hopene/tetraprenyl-beta-curcumene cyclase
MLSIPGKIVMVLRAVAIVFVCGFSTVYGGEPITLENVQDPGANRSDEPLASNFSLEKAVHFMDAAALHWQKSRACCTCHTNYAHLYARPYFSSTVPAAQEVRKFTEALVQERWETKGPRWDAEVVATAAALAYNDAATTGKLHAVTRQALDRMWTVQREDGGFDWLKCDWPPMESDDFYGATLTALAVGRAPDGYAETAAARNGMQKLRRYLQATPAPSLHHEAMLLWASRYVPDLLTAEQKVESIKKLSALQKADGGWALATLGDWKRADQTPQSTEQSDGYGTGFVLFVLRQANVPADDARITKGIAWLKSHQRESGRWFTRSLHKDNKHFITHAGTAFALMALAECGVK